MPTTVVPADDRMHHDSGIEFVDICAARVQDHIGTAKLSLREGQTVPYYISIEHLPRGLRKCIMRRKCSRIR